MQVQSRRRGASASAELLHVTVDDVGGKQHNSSSGRGGLSAHYQKPQGFSLRALVGSAAALVIGLFTLWEANRFCTSRCYLIDWSAGSTLRAVPVVYTQRELDERIATHEPALLQGALRKWPALSKWSPEFFGRELAPRRVEIFFWGRSGADWMRTRVYVLTMAEYTKLLTRYEVRVAELGREHAGPAPYLQEDEALIAENGHTLLGDVLGLPYKPFLRPAHAPTEETRDHHTQQHLQLSSGGYSPHGGWARAGVQTETAFWMGPTNARTGIHWDSIDAILHQLHGTKHVQLWPPSARSDLYVSTKYNHGAELSLVDAARPNHTSFPRYAHASTLSVELAAGSALYLPAGWWHAVTSLDATISVALRSQSACERRAALVDDLLLWMHERGLYKAHDCVCHRPKPKTSGSRAGGDGDDDDGLGQAVDALLREAGVEVDADGVSTRAGPVEEE